MLSNGEISLIQDSISMGLRLDGRSCGEFRDYSISQGSFLFPQALYGLQLHVPNSSCKISIGVNAEIKEKLENQSKSSEEYLKIQLKTAGIQETNSLLDQVTELEALLSSHIASNIDCKVLDLYDGKLYWMVLCDLYIIGEVSLSIFNYLYRAVKEALINCRFPSLTISYNNWNEKYSYEVEALDKKLFQPSCFPFVYMIGEFGGNLIFDFTEEELKAMNTIYICVANKSNNAISLEKLDGKPISVNKLGVLLKKLIDQLPSLMSINS